MTHYATFPSHAPFYLNFWILRDLNSFTQGCNFLHILLMNITNRIWDKVNLANSNTHWKCLWLCRHIQFHDNIRIISGTGSCYQIISLLSDRNQYKKKENIGIFCINHLYYFVHLYVVSVVVSWHMSALVQFRLSLTHRQGQRDDSKLYQINTVIPTHRRDLPTKQWRFYCI